MAERIDKTINRVMTQMAQNIPEKVFNLGVSIRKDYFEGRITKDEFLKQCTYLMLNCGFEELYPKTLPERPQELLEYDMLSIEKKMKIKPEFWSSLDIQNYCVQKMRIISQAISDKKWLNENLKRLKKYNDEENVQILKDRFRKYNQWEVDNWEDIKQFYKV